MSKWTNTSSAFSYALLSLWYQVKLDDDFIFLPRRRNEPRAIYSACWVSSGFGSPLPFRIRNKKQAPLAVLLHAFFRGSCSACSPVSWTPFTNDSCPMTRDAIFSRDVCCAPYNGCNTVIYGDVPIFRLTLTRKIRFFPMGVRTWRQKLIMWNNRPNNRPESSRFRFRLFPSNNRITEDILRSVSR